MLLDTLVQNRMPPHTMETSYILNPMVIRNDNCPVLNGNGKHIEIY